MAKTTTDHTKLALQRLALDEEVQEHLANAAVQLREAWQRAAHRPPARVVEDKQLYARIRRAAISLARAVKLLGPEPEPPKRRGRKLIMIVLAAGTGALIVKKRRTAVSPSAQAEPAATPPTTTPAEPQVSAA